MLTEKLSEAGFEVEDWKQNETERALQMLMIISPCIASWIVMAHDNAMTKMDFGSGPCQQGPIRFPR